MDSTYTEVTIYKDPIPNPNTKWLQISQNRIYKENEMMESYPPASTPEKLYLHLDENLTGSIRTGIITVKNSAGIEKKLRISQLPAIPVGRFGHYNKITDDSIFSTMLYTEQLYEFKTMPRYIGVGSPVPFVNAIYNGRTTATSTSIFTWANYSNSSNYFNYQNELYEAINYCAYKNRITSEATITDELMWYLPSQAQLMGMWLSYTSYVGIKTSNFAYNGHVADYFWSSTSNEGYPNYAQYMNFTYGNLGHYKKGSKLWARCVRDGSDGSPTPNSMIITAGDSVVIDFEEGMPKGSYSLDSKNNKDSEHELLKKNETLYQKLRVALTDLASGVEWDINACDGYSETGADAGTWRLPTQRELQAIWILQSEMKKELSTFTLLADDYYWSATDAKETIYAGQSSGTHAWTIFGSGSRVSPGSSGNAPHQSKSTPLRVRCVHEVPQ
jgi:hypothetical protein